jgi:hypothetical protein
MKGQWAINYLTQVLNDALQLCTVLAKSYFIHFQILALVAILARLYFSTDELLRNGRTQVFAWRSKNYFLNYETETPIIL